MVLHLLILLGLILLNAFFAMAEISIVTLNDKKVKKLASQGHHGAMNVMKLTENSSDFLATIQVGVTLSGFLTSASASMSFSGVVAEALSFLSIPRNVIEGLSTVIVTLILSYFSLVLGELVPKKIAMQNAEGVSYKVVGVLLVIAKIFKPFISFLSFSTNLVVKALGFNPNASEQTVTEEEILMLVDAGEEKGMIEERAKDMIINIFDFDNITVEDIMTHRTDIIALDESSTVNDIVDVSLNKGCSRIPIYQDDLDDIIGVIYVKDLLKYVTDDMPEKIHLKDIMRPISFIPSSKKCNELFTELTSSKIQIAIVVDEYGGTEGLVTMEDLVEAIVGNIQDEYDNEEEEIRQINENKFTIDGSTSLDDVEEVIKMKLPKGNYETISGFMVNHLGRIPKKDEYPSITINNIKFTVQEVTDRKISKIDVEIEPTSSEETFEK